MGSWYDAVATASDQLAGPADEVVGQATSAANDALPVGFGQYSEAYSRALGSGLVEPQTGSSSLTDPGGEFFEGEYSGSAYAPDVVLSGSGEAAEQGADAAAGAAEFTADVAVDAAGATWDALGTKGKLAVGVVGAAVALQAFEPATDVATAAAGGES